MQLIRVMSSHKSHTRSEPVQQPLSLNAVQICVFAGAGLQPQRKTARSIALTNA